MTYFRVVVCNEHGVQRIEFKDEESARTCAELVKSNGFLHICVMIYRKAETGSTPIYWWNVCDAETTQSQ